MWAAPSSPRLRWVDRPQIFPELGVGLGDTRRILDGDVAGRRSEDREAHRHAVILVALDDRILQRARLDLEPVRTFLDLLAKAAELRHRGSQAIGFLDA